MKSSLLLLAGFTLLAGLPGRASADVGIALGPVLAEDAIGMRAGFDASLFVVAAERYSGDDEQRTRGELALRIPLTLSRGIRLAPQLGLAQLDDSADGTPTMDSTPTWSTSSWVALRLGW